MYHIHEEMMGKAMLVEGFKHLLFDDWVVVSNIFYFPQYMG